MTTDNGIVAFLTWSGVYDEPFSSDALAQQLTTLPRAYLLRGLSMIATVLVNSGGIRGRGQRDLAAEILDGGAQERALRLFDTGEVGAFVHPDAILQATRLVLRHSADRGAEDGSAFGPLLLGANELLGDRPSKSIDELAGIVLHNWAFGGSEQLRYLIPRYFDLLVSRASLYRSGSPDLATLFSTAANGLSITEFLAFSLTVHALYGRFRSATSLGEFGYGVVLDEVAGRALSPDRWGRYRRLVEMPLTDALSLVASGADAPVGFGEYLAFRAKPLVRLAERESLPIWLPWVTSKIAEDARWLIASSLHGDGSMVARLNGFLGLLFEEYAFELLVRCYPANGALRVLYPPISYETERGTEESNDATLFAGDTALFMEMTITRPRFADLWEGNTAKYRAFVEERFVTGDTQKLAKLSRRITDFRKGVLAIGGVEPRTVARIWPVVVTLVPWPHHAILARALEPIFRTLDPYGGPPALPGVVERPVFISIEELEMIEESLRTGLTLTGLVKDWQESSQADSSLKNYLLLGHQGYREQPNAYLRARFLEVVAALKEEAAALVRMDDVDAEPG